MGLSSIYAKQAVITMTKTYDEGTLTSISKTYDMEVTDKFYHASHRGDYASLVQRYILLMFIGKPLALCYGRCHHNCAPLEMPTNPD